MRTLPLAGHATRPLTLDDLPRVVAIATAEEVLDVGETITEEADHSGRWSRPDFDLAGRTIGVLDGAGALVAFAVVPGGPRASVNVHPDHHGRGIGTALAGWVRDRAARDGVDRIGMSKPEGSPGERLLAGLGWTSRFTSWVLELPAGKDIPSRSLPIGWVVREARPDEYADVWDVVEHAFVEWANRDVTPQDEWVAEVTGHPGFAPWTVRVACGPDGRPVAASVMQLASEGAEAVVDSLATRPVVRNRGLAQVLLADSSRVARANGAARLTLGTDSRTGALGLYEKVGMVVTSSWVHRAMDLDPLPG